MSKGPGRVQRVINDMIAAEPEGAWTTDDICRRVYPNVTDVEKRHRVAVLRALRKMKLPSNDWRFELVGRGGEYCLFDCCSDESGIRLEYIRHLAECRLRGWKVTPLEEWKGSGHYKRPIANAIELAASRREFRDATAIEKLNIRIRDTRMLNSFGYKQHDVSALIAERDALVTELDEQSDASAAIAESQAINRNYNPIIDAWDSADAEARREFVLFYDRIRTR